MPTDQGWNLRDRNVQSKDGPIDTRIYLLAFSVLFGLSAAALSGYSYGLSNLTEQLPIVFRLIDPGYLTNDFFVNATQEFGPRFYYSHLLAFLAGYVPLHGAMAVLWLLAYVSVIVVTAFTARDITGSVLGGMSAAILVTLSAPFFLGSDSPLFKLFLVPGFLAMPFGMFAIWNGIKGKPIHAAIASIPAVLLHPTIGLETAGLALAAVAANRVYRWWARREITSRQVWTMSAGTLIVGLTSLIWVVPAILTGASFSVEEEKLVTIYANFRHPHHLVPSTWQMKDWVLGTGFAVTVGIGLIEMFGAKVTSGSARREHLAIGFAIIAIFAVIGVALVGGYIFVELIPTRVAVVAQTFRMVTVAAWLGWIVVAGLIAELFEVRAWRWAVLFALSTVSTPTLLVYKGITFAVSRLNGGGAMNSTVFFAGVAMLTVETMAFTQAWIGQPNLRDFILMALGLPGVLAISISRKLTPVAFGILTAGLVLISASFVLDRFGLFPNSVPGASSYVARNQPILTLDEAFHRGDAHDRALVVAARDTTHPDAVFLIPWNWRHWRMFANRAVVVEYKAFPFREEAVLEWYERYLAIYDEGAGYPYDVTESELLELQRRYGFHYAVLPIGADMSFPVTATSERWKLVQVAETVP